MTNDVDGNTPGYEVGYGKPPKEHQFKKGHTKSKGLRRKRRPSFAAMFDEEYLANIVIVEGGKKKIPAIRAIMRRHKLKALSGDERATLSVLKIAQQFMPQDPHEEGDEQELSDAEIAVMKDILAAKALFGIGNDE